MTASARRPKSGEVAVLHGEPAAGRSRELLRWLAPNAESRLRMAVVAALVGSWAVPWWWILAHTGLFRWLGVDYGLYRSQTLALWSGGSAALYDLDALRGQLQALVRYTALPGLPLAAGSVPYPPLFAWLFSPFTWLAAPVGFVLWSLFNLAAAVHLAWRSACFFPAPTRWWAGALVMTSFPVVYSLMVGQPTILLGCAVAEAYLCLRAERAFRGGLWVAGLLLKPQYGVLVGLFLIWKRQWRAVAGAVTGVAAVVGASLVVAGPAALRGYPSSLVELSTFNGVGTFAFPQQHINWRGMILRLWPDVPNGTGVMLALALGAITVGVAMWVWRGAWAPQSPRFATQMVALMVGTLLANYHSHSHGATILIVPLAANVAQGGLGRIGRVAAKILLFAPTLTFVASRSVELTASTMCLGMLLLLGGAFWENRVR